VKKLPKPVKHGRKLEKYFRLLPYKALEKIILTAAEMIV
jgi:hypothetical protein